MKTILEKARMMGDLTHLSAAHLSYALIAEKMALALDANAYIVDEHHQVVGSCIVDGEKSQLLIAHEKMRIHPSDIQQFNTIKQTEVNIDITNELMPFSCYVPEELADSLTMVVPICCEGERLGTLIFVRFGTIFCDNDVALGEYAASIVGIQFLKDKVRQNEERHQQKIIAMMAIDTLTCTEAEALDAVLKAVGHRVEGRFVASKVSEQFSIARSIIIRALKKLEEAGLLETRSLGMKGTYVKVINPYLLTQFQQLIAEEKR